MNIFHDLISDLYRIFSNISPSVRSPLAVCLGAIPGALSRYYLTILLNKWLGTDFPYGTFFINITGALIMGFVFTLAVERSLISPELRLLIATGFLGSYTTFSTYALDSSLLWRSGSLISGSFYWLGSSILGVIGLELGSFLARKL